MKKLCFLITLFLMFSGTKVFCSALTATSFTPQNKSTTGDMTADISITFSAKITLNSGYIYIYRINNTLFQKIDVMLGDVSAVENQLIIKHAEFEENQTYYILMNAGIISDGQSSFAGINKGDWTFTKTPSPETPINLLSPYNGSTSALANETLTAYFSKPVTAGNGKIIIHNYGGDVFAEVPSKNVNFKDGGRAAVIHHSPFSNGKTYYITFSHDAFRVDGIPCPAQESDYFWRFTINDGAETVYSDVAGHWGEKFITAITKKGIVGGVGGDLFEPDKFVTRAQFAQMIRNAYSLPPQNFGTKPFSDVSQSEWFYDAIMRLKSEGLLDFITDDDFRPDDPITREEIAAIAARTIMYANIPLIQSYVLLEDTFDDFSQMSFLSDIEIVVRLKIMSGIAPNIFSPKTNATRAQAAAVIYNLIGLTEKP